MDERLSMALEFANYRQTLSIQRKTLKEKINAKLTYGYAGGLFKINRELIVFVQMLIDQGRTENVPLIDENGNPVLIADLQIFKDEIIDRYFTATYEYYEDYQKSYYGVTMKKAGWDAMRHYEILGNYCIPYFIGLENCPEGTLANMPKELLFEARELANNFEEQKYFSILNEIFSYTKNNLTTKSIANYIISKL